MKKKKKNSKIIFFSNEIFYIFTTSSLSKYYNYFSISFPMNSIKLEGDLQPTLRSLGQFMFTKINDYICHLIINDIFLN
jgi:hypothetical protein